MRPTLKCDKPHNTKKPIKRQTHNATNLISDKPHNATNPNMRQTLYCDKPNNVTTPKMRQSPFCDKPYKRQTSWGDKPNTDKPQISHTQ